jgi:hypothetical protein
MSAYQYAAALREVSASQVPFRLPRLLCGPFTGRRAAIQARYDDRTEEELKTIFRYMNGGLPRSEDEHWRHVVASGGAWLKDQMALPVPRDPVAAHAHLDDAAYVETIFGKTDVFEAALARHRSGKRPRKAWWPFG